MKYTYIYKLITTSPTEQKLYEYLNAKDAKTMNDKGGLGELFTQTYRTVPLADKLALTDALEINDLEKTVAIKQLNKLCLIANAFKSQANELKGSPAKHARAKYALILALIYTEAMQSEIKDEELVLVKTALQELKQLYENGELENHHINSDDVKFKNKLQRFFSKYPDTRKTLLDYVTAKLDGFQNKITVNKTDIDLQHSTDTSVKSTIENIHSNNSFKRANESLTSSNKIEMDKTIKIKQNNNANISPVTGTATYSTTSTQPINIPNINKTRIHQVLSNESLEENHKNNTNNQPSLPNPSLSLTSSDFSLEAFESDDSIVNRSSISETKEIDQPASLTILLANQLRAIILGYLDVWGLKTHTPSFLPMGVTIKNPFNDRDITVPYDIEKLVHIFINHNAVTASITDEIIAEDIMTDYCKATFASWIANKPYNTNIADLYELSASCALICFNDGKNTVIHSITDKKELLIKFDKTKVTQDTINNASNLLSKLQNQAANQYINNNVKEKNPFGMKK